MFSDVIYTVDAGDTFLRVNQYFGPPLWVEIMAGGADTAVILKLPLRHAEQLHEELGLALDYVLGPEVK